ncbi:hypothetical protein D3C76_518960 [compost metagenome]
MHLGPPRVRCAPGLDGPRGQLLLVLQLLAIPLQWLQLLPRLPDLAVSLHHRRQALRVNRYGRRWRGALGGFGGLARGFLALRPEVLKVGEKAPDTRTGGQRLLTPTGRFLRNLGLLRGSSMGFFLPRYRRRAYIDDLGRQLAFQIRHHLTQLGHGTLLLDPCGAELQHLATLLLVAPLAG